LKDQAALRHLSFIIPKPICLSSSNFHDVQRHFQQYFSYIVVVSFIGGGTGGPGENHFQILSHNIVQIALIEIRTNNISGDS
jgi:hypothetical protein